MWNEIVALLKKFPTAVLTGVDANGYPFSVRCTPQVDESRKRLHIGRTAGIPLDSGPAGLLCHSHNEKLWNLKSFLVLGKIEQNEQSWVFHPKKLYLGMGLEGPRGMWRSLLKSRSTSRKYLQKRGLARPKVRWDEFKAAAAESKNGG